MEAPQRFTERLHSLFEGRLRIRWSSKRHEWHLEYKVAPGRILNFPTQSNDDAMIRARDGYAFIIAVRTGDRMPCPRCGCTMAVPMFELAETKCDYCVLQGRDGRYPASYFPLDGDMLLNYLTRLDPQRTWRDGLAKKTDENNRRMELTRERAWENQVNAQAREHATELFNIQSVGYTGKEKSYANV